MLESSLARLRTSLLFCACVAAIACSDPPAEDLDGGGEDASVVACTTDTQCSNGVFCDGAERCLPSDPDADADGCVAAAAACMAGQRCDEDADACITECEVTEDADGDGALAPECGGTDCDDSDASAHPGAIEVCDPDHVDEDCDPATLGARDRDADGFADDTCCNDRGDGVRVCGEDCNDLERTVGPTAGELCDGFDNDCDGAVDELVSVRGFRDADGDLHGAPGTPVSGCPGEARFSAVDDDCDDTSPHRHGSQSEACNGQDDDCDGTVDEATSALTWYRDGDGDGFGDPMVTVTSCAPVAGHVLIGLDCDDTDGDVSPGESEQCNGRDDDCNGRADFRVGRGDYEDDDHDLRPDAECADDATVADCDDRNPDVRPGAPELLDGVDNDCDDGVDDVCRLASWYVDADGDGYGDGASEAMRSCEPIEGRAPRDGDCDDADPARSPALADVCNDVDDDCDGTVDELTHSLCFLDHALGQCSDGACEIAECGKGWRDCDTAATTGCEISIASDAAHCGACGNACAAGARSIAACSAGRCGLTCDEGYGDCNEDVADGCEADVYADVLSCGACGRVCSNRPNAARLCALGSCGFDCAVGYEDCDGIAGNGCEVGIGRDPSNCGACGMTCGTAGEICIDRSCETPTFASTGAEGPLAPAAGAGVVVLTPGVHHYTTIDIPAGVTVVTSGSGVLDLRASGLVRIAGTIDVSGSRGGHGGSPYPTSDSGGGGHTGNPLTPGVDFVAEGVPQCGPPGTGGMGAPGTAGGVTGGAGTCSLPGMFGGGAGGVGLYAGGGGGGYAGGAGGTDYQETRLGGNGGATAGETAALGAHPSTGPCVPAQGGRAPGAYAGGSPSNCYGGAGGSIGTVAAGDLAVATTFRPGSGGGGGGGFYPSMGAGGGGGAGGALRIATPTRIELESTGRLLANGGRGGDGANGNHGGGGGSGGVIALSAPGMRLDGTISATGGGAGGTVASFVGAPGGLGRVRLSVLAEECAITGPVSPSPIAGCAPSTVPEHPYVARYPL